MRFVNLSIVVFAVICAGGLLQVLVRLTKPTLLGGLSDWPYLVVSLGGLFFLTLAAIRFRNRDEPGFDMLVASETVIVLGIVSLVLGLVWSVIIGLYQPEQLSSLKFIHLRPVLLPFVQGLLAAGFAPALAALLRNFEVVKFGDGDTPTLADDTIDTKKITREMAALTKDLGRAKKAVTTFAETFEASTEQYKGAVGEIANATSGLATGISRETADFRDALGQAGKQIKDFSVEITEAGNEGTKTLRSLDEQVKSLKNSMEETTTLLEGLANLIESVERFIDPSLKKRT